MSSSRIAGTLLILIGLNACTSFGGNPPRTRLSDDFSYYEPFDNSGEMGPDYLIGPPPPNDTIVHLPDDKSAKSLPSIPNESLPPSCLSCD